MRLRFYKGAALQAAIAGDRLRPAVLQPGIHGGQGYYDDHGIWRYGEPPPAFRRPKPTPLAEQLERYRQKRIAVGRALKRHIDAYAATGRPVEFARETERPSVAVLSRIPRVTGGHRITHFDEAGPSGHTEFDTLEGAVRELLGDRVSGETVPGRVQGWTTQPAWAEGMQRLAQVREDQKRADALMQSFSKGGLEAFLLKADQLGLFASRKDVEQPGSRGGHGYFDNGVWRYGERPELRQADAMRLVAEQLGPAYRVRRRSYRHGGKVEVLGPDGAVVASGHSYAAAVEAALAANAQSRSIAPSADAVPAPAPASGVLHRPRLKYRAGEEVNVEGRRGWIQAVRGYHVTVRWEDGTETTVNLLPDVPIAKAATLTFGTKKKPAAKTKTKKAPEGAGALELHATRSGKPVWASGAESGGYSDDDHADAGAVHAKVHGYHQEKAIVHRHAGDGDDDWRRSEAHAGEHDRHQALADHHLELARHHLTAAGKGSAAALEVRNGQPVLGEATPLAAAERTESRAHLKARTHHDHPGGTTRQDEDAYRALAPQKGRA